MGHACQFDTRALYVCKRVKKNHVLYFSFSCDKVAMDASLEVCETYKCKKNCSWGGVMDLFRYGGLVRFYVHATSLTFIAG